MNSSRAQPVDFAVKTQTRSASRACLRPGTASANATVESTQLYIKNASQMQLHLVKSPKPVIRRQANVNTVLKIGKEIHRTTDTY